MAMAVSTCSTEIPSPLPLIVGQLHPTVNASCTADVPTKFDLVVSASYAGKCNSSSIVDGKMLLGFVPVGLSLRKLQGDRMLIQVETKNNRDLFNLESGSLSKSPSQKNITFSFEQEFPVFNIKPASVLIYDHYEIGQTQTEKRSQCIYFPSFLLQSLHYYLLMVLAPCPYLAPPGGCLQREV
ncbi:ovostatin-like isoform X2 [Chelonia mydas]|uniref:ovostatin-like isoform X2 n=1 Tax=Chelonia mydas TaxID=8469 RepID=UPI001CA87325|nr:ovostatin-like isoform X2 [Chelonia mydas]